MLLHAVKGLCQILERSGRDSEQQQEGEGLIHCYPFLWQKKICEFSWVVAIAG